MADTGTDDGSEVLKEVLFKQLHGRQVNHLQQPKSDRHTSLTSAHSKHACTPGNALTPEFRRKPRKHSPRLQNLGKQGSRTESSHDGYAIFFKLGKHGFEPLLFVVCEFEVVVFAAGAP